MSLASSTRCLPGFSKRLNSLLDATDVPMTGRYALIAKVTGMGHSNSRALFINDRPPKKAQFVSKLLHYFVSNIGATLDTRCEIADIHDYLYLDKGPIKTQLLASLAQADSDVSHIPLPVQTKVIRQLTVLSDRESLDVFVSLSDPQLNALLKTLMLFVHEGQDGGSGKAFEDVAKSAFTLAKYNLL